MNIHSTASQTSSGPIKWYFKVIIPFEMSYKLFSLKASCIQRPIGVLKYSWFRWLHIMYINPVHAHQKNWMEKTNWIKSLTNWKRMNDNSLRFKMTSYSEQCGGRYFGGYSCAISSILDISVLSCKTLDCNYITIDLLWHVKK